jgi:tetratricopeptide (TPR) repeat protein
VGCKALSFEFMKKMVLLYSLIFSLMIFYLGSCSGHNDEGTILNDPPYKTITDSIKDAPTHADLYHKRGTLLLQAEELDLAKADFSKAWNLEGSEDNAISLASLLMKKNSDSAILFIEEALKKLPQSIVLQVSLARGYQQKKNYNGALNVCNKIIAQFPNQIDALLLKAELLQTMNRGAQALQTLEQAYRYAPFDAELSYNLAFEYAQVKNSKALAVADSLIKMDSSKSHAEPYYIKGVYYSNNGNTALALSFFNQAIQHDYYFLDAYMDKGALLYDRKDYTEALKTFQLAVRVSPTFADAYYWQGKTQEAMGNKLEAKQNYERAFSLDKTLTEAKTAADKL